MKGDGSLKTCHNIHDLRKALEKYDKDLIDAQSITTEIDDSRPLIVDGMAVVQSVVNGCNKSVNTTCEVMSEIFVSTIDNLAKKYFSTRVIFDNYAKPHSVKDKLRYDANETSDIIVDDETAIDSTLSSRKTKERVTLYLDEKLFNNSNKRIVTVTREDVRSNINEVKPTTPVSTQEEANTLMIIHAVEIVKMDSLLISSAKTQIGWFFY
ncbi:hypothetical protein DPMN_173861 [Dreissena polymorpha]|uniref:Uncharacterized protein n=1 Tax=Dreissena polymorpha TaxID=45954 RepID=A0A9D4IEL4_DREPO|nr:hypothetical protein DPMN_173861 [Dreissena polymorpha]